MKYAIVLAAGTGTRMRSRKNKVMHQLLHKPIIGHVIDHLEAIDIEETVVVTGFEGDAIKAYLKDRVQYATQDEQIGTGNAVASARQLEGKVGSTLILSGDSALVQAETLNKIIEKHQGFDLTIVSAQVKDPRHYSRVIRDTQGFVEKVVEARDATQLESTTKEINLGVYCFNNELLFKYLPEIKDDMREELNISDLVAVMNQHGHTIQALKLDNDWEFMGVNDRHQLAEANQYLRDRINFEHLTNGVSILDPMATYIGPDVKIGQDATIYPNTHIYGKTNIGEGAIITSGSWIEDSDVGANTLIDSSKICGSIVGNNSKIGPYAHIRMESKVGDYVRTGNFVEYKNVNMGNHSSSAHLSYLGDADVGEYVNIGCGVVTINYDGKGKYRTVIGDHTFVGSHVGLIAPINIGENAVLAAGSTITEDVESGDLAIARARQAVKKNYGTKYLKEKGKI